MSDDFDTDTADALREIAIALKWLGTGDAATRMGAIEYHAKAIKEGMSGIAYAIEELADAIRESAPRSGAKK